MSLTALPLQEQVFTLNKQEFQNALCLRYEWQLKNLPSHCVCGSVFSTDHAMTCSHGVLTITRHNDICDITGNWLSEVKCWERTPPTASHRWKHRAPFCKQTWRCESWHSCNRLLGMTAMCIFWYKGFSPKRTKLSSFQYLKSIPVTWTSKENMETESERLRMVPSLHLSLPQQEAWVVRLHYSTSVSRIKYLKRGTPYTAKPWHGLGTPSPSPSYDQQWCAFEAATQHLTEYQMPALNWVSQRAGSLARTQPLHSELYVVCS